MFQTVRAKFYCTSITKYIGFTQNPETGKYEAAPAFNYKFQAVTSGSEENKKFFASTPSGTIELSALREDLFELNKEYYLDFTPAPMPS
jgi:hypothetical protein